MKIINGNKYSRDVFEDYKLRVKIEIIDKDNNDYNFDIYTTQDYLQKIRIDLETVKSDNVKIINILHTSTKRQDDLVSDMIKGWLNES